MPHARILVGDVRKRLADVADKSVQCVVTSPPYFGLRDYGVDGQLGMEPTPDEYVASMVEVFREVRRVLRDDGTLWLNLGDSYASNTAAGTKEFGNPAFNVNRPSRAATKTAAKSVPKGLKAKDLIGIPWRVAFALQADGWYLRADCIWNKNNPMPESVEDRPTKSHEYVFLLTKSERYFFDAVAIRDRSISAGRAPGGNHKLDASRNDHARDTSIPVADHRNARTVWTINSKPFKEAHFATMPVKLAIKCIKAGTSEHGACSACGAPWGRVLEVPPSVAPTPTDGLHAKREPQSNGFRITGRIKAMRASAGASHDSPFPERRTIEWRAVCTCSLGHLPATRPCIVLDPFGGAGTTLVAASMLLRDSIACELNPKYAEMARKRFVGKQPLVNTAQVIA